MHDVKIFAFINSMLSVTTSVQNESLYLYLITNNIIHLIQMAPKVELYYGIEMTRKQMVTPINVLTSLCAVQLHACLLATHMQLSF